jgi:hypothetical protein
MSSYIINGECISGACKATELFRGQLGIYLLIGCIVVLGFLIYIFNKEEVKV